MSSAVRHRWAVAQSAVPPAPTASAAGAGISPATPASSTSTAAAGTVRNTSQSARVRGRALVDAATAADLLRYLEGEGWALRCGGVIAPTSDNDAFPNRLRASITPAHAPPVRYM